MKSRFFNSELTQLLRQSGWFPGRRLDCVTIESWRNALITSDGLDMPPEAELVLRDFGGLRIGSVGRGVNVARTSLDLDPLHAEGGAREIKRLANAANVDILYPLGVFGDHDGLIVIAGNGNIFVDYDMDSPIGINFDEALEKLLLGIK